MDTIEFLGYIGDDDAYFPHKNIKRKKANRRGKKRALKRCVSNTNQPLIPFPPETRDNGNLPNEPTGDSGGQDGIDSNEDACPAEDEYSTADDESLSDRSESDNDSKAGDECDGPSGPVAASADGSKSPPEDNVGEQTTSISDQCTTTTSERSEPPHGEPVRPDLERSHTGEPPGNSGEADVEMRDTTEINTYCTT